MEGALSRVVLSMLNHAGPEITTLEVTMPPKFEPRIQVTPKYVLGPWEGRASWRSWGPELLPLAEVAILHRSTTLDRNSKAVLQPRPTCLNLNGNLKMLPGRYL